ncbi:MAG: CBS domain-containing protein [Deltaproteobacteria bacterium]|nr:CBS domain-containing protein [Deltaproteobacteria bacterium]
MVNLTARDIMNQDVLSVGMDWSVDQLSDFLVEHSISGAPVISEDGKLRGVVSLMDLVRYRSMPAMESKEDEPHEYYIHTSELNYSNEEIKSFHLDTESLITVEDIMTHRTFEVGEETKVRDVADVMIRGNIHRVLVTRNAALVGIITTMDMLRIIRDF